MKKWMGEFIRLCTAGIPNPLYKKRLAKELADHLDALASDLEETGLSPSQAQELALERMGDPSELSRHFQEECLRHITTPRYTATHLFLGCLGTGLAYLIVHSVLSYFGLLPSDAVPGLSWEQRAQLLDNAGFALFLLSFSFGALLLSRSFAGRPHLPLLVTSGLLLAWFGEKVSIFFLSSLIYGIPMGELNVLQERICGGGDPTASWFTLSYIWNTLLMCPVLGLLAALAVKMKTSKFSRLSET